MSTKSKILESFVASVELFMIACKFCNDSVRKQKNTKERLEVGLGLRLLTEPNLPDQTEKFGFVQ